eukprot:3770085-Lingulodinium_polyedra.AAC.1
MSGHRMQGLVQRIYNPERCTHIKYVLAALEQWDSYCEEYVTAIRKEKGNEQWEIPMSSKVFSIKSLITKELEADVDKMQLTDATRI